jgi:DNA-binding LytR/AlgR family response regulator
MKVLIIEDEPLAAQRLRLLLGEFDNSIEVTAVIESVEDAVNWFNHSPLPDLLFLDIELADGSSFHIFSKINVQCPIIFTTAYDKYALDAFKLFSIDYLLKPVTLLALAKAINKYKMMAGRGLQIQGIQQVIEALQPQTQPYKSRFLVKLGSRMFFVESADIAYFFADDKTVHLVNKEGAKFVIDLTLEKLHMVLDPRYFFRLNRKVICSIAAIKEIKTYLNSRLRIIMRAGNHSSEAIVSRERVQDFKDWAGA